MEKKFTKPKGFGEILDHTFSLCKKHFKDFFMILLIIMGPIYLLEAIVQLASGTSFFRQVGGGSQWFTQIVNSFEESQTFDSSSIGADIGTFLSGIISFVFSPVAEGAILFGLLYITKNEEYTIKLLIKKAFSRFWPLLGSTILFGLIAFGLIGAAILIIALIVWGSVVMNPILGIILGIVLFLGFTVGIIYFLTRWSFYLGSVVLDRISPGLGNSWRLTRKRTWVLAGLFIVFYLINSIVSFTIQSALGIALGNSVLLSIIVNIVSLFTTMISYVGFGVMYLDLKTRHDADDLKELIEDYHSSTLS